MMRGALDYNARVGSELASLRSSGLCRVELVRAKAISPCVEKWNKNFSLNNEKLNRKRTPGIGKQSSGEYCK